MYVFACADDQGGVAFNHRRQSRDRTVMEKILALSAGNPLWMSPSSAKLFPPEAPIRPSERCLEEAGEEDFCFAEQQSLAAYAGRIHRLYLFRWNRVYPADTWLALDLSAWRQTVREEFPGCSHEKITLEVYER